MDQETATRSLTTATPCYGTRCRRLPGGVMDQGLGQRRLPSLAPDCGVRNPSRGKMLPLCGSHEGTPEGAGTRCMAGNPQPFPLSNRRFNTNDLRPNHQAAPTSLRAMGLSLAILGSPISMPAVAGMPRSLTATVLAFQVMPPRSQRASIRVYLGEAI